jgi:nickel superoxide dismutase
MKRLLSTAAVVAMFGLPAAFVFAHCEMPCGIYHDDRRFEEMHEDQETIAKAIDQIRTLSETHSPTDINQVGRWIVTKEEHATNTQHLIAQYFMTQRIKPEDANYAERLQAAHAVMVAAMKCKQDADPATADALHDAIDMFQDAYSK